MPDPDPMRVRELTRAYDQLQSEERHEAQLTASRLVALFPLDREVRILAARVALELGNRDSRAQTRASASDQKNIVSRSSHLRQAPLVHVAGETNRGPSRLQWAGSP